MTEINNSTNSFLDELLEAAPDDLYIKEIARTFETEQMARLSQSLFKTYALTGMLFEKIKRSSLLTKLTQVYQSTPTTKEIIWDSLSWFRKEFELRCNLHKPEGNYYTLKMIISNKCL